MSHDPTGELSSQIARQIAANHDAVETMVERSLVTPGNRGVLVTPLPGGAVRAELSDVVPFGEIHYLRA